MCSMNNFLLQNQICEILKYHKNNHQLPVVSFCFLALVRDPSEIPNLGERFRVRVRFLNRYERDLMVQGKGVMKRQNFSTWNE